MNLAFWGVFDWESLGDSMFPRILAEVLKERLNFDYNHIFLFSLTEQEKSYNENGHIYAIDSFEQIYKKYGIDWIILCGGELFHNLPIQYKNLKGEVCFTRPGFFWKKAYEYSEKFKIPVIANLLGTPYEFREDERISVQKAINQFAYLSVRDRFSGDRLLNAGVPRDKIHIYSDGLLLFSRYYPEELLQQIRKQLEEKGTFRNPGDYVVVQYDTTKHINILCDVLKRISHRYHVAIVLLPVNRCHSDVETAAFLYECSGGEFINVDAYLQPAEIMSIIAGARFFIGTSFHGSVIAMSYGVPCIALDMYPTFVSKVDGLYDEFDLCSNIVGDLYGLEKVFERVWEDKEKPGKILRKVEEKQIELDQYYDQLCMIIEGKEKNRSFLEKNIPEEKGKTIWKKSILKAEKKCFCYNSYAALGENGIIEFVFDIDERQGGRYCWYSFLNRPVKISSMEIAEGECDFTVVEGEKISDNEWIFGGLKCEVCFELPEAYREKLRITCIMEELPWTQGFKAMQTVLNNKEAHIEQLLESERRYYRKLQQMQENNSELEAEIESLKVERGLFEEKSRQLVLEQLHLKKHVDELEYQQNEILNSKRWKLITKISGFMRGEK